jgi:hypothetical protein
VLIAGGLVGTSTTSWEIYDDTSGNGTFPLFATGGHELTVPTRKWHVDAQFSNGKVLLAGGTADGVTSVTSTDVFNPAAATLGFTAGPTPLLIGRMQHGGAYSSTSSELLNLVGGSLLGPAVEQLPSP